MKTLTVRLPAFLAYALINGDETGLECTCASVANRSDELHHRSCGFYWLNKAIEYCAPGRIVDVADDEGGQNVEPYFSRYCDLPGWHLGADMLDYVVLYNDKEVP